MHKSVHVWQTLDGRPSGSTGSESRALCLFGSTGRSTVACNGYFFELAVDRAGRPTCTDLCTFSRHWTVDRQGRPGLRAELSVWVDRDGRPVAANRQNLTVGRSTGPVDRQCISGIFFCQRLYFSGGYKYPIGKSFSLSFLVRIFSYSLVF